MSLSDLPRNRFDPLPHFPRREDSIQGFFPQSISSSTFLGRGISQFSGGLYSHHPATFNMTPLSPEEMERYQELSNKFEPELPGPLVSQKQSTNIIAMEYANADPVFATKTSALAVTHPQLRIMKGDGNCGWRAVAFGFFEILFNLRDAQRVQSELVRIKSLNTLLDQVGQEEYLYDGFVEATTEVFAKILAAIEQGVRDDSFLVDLFNDEYGSNAIITHFRLLASAWMKLNPHRYQNFLLSMTVDQYCATRIETVKSEIDELGLQALVDGVIEGSGLAVEILYLDRSQGDSVNLHPLSQTRQGVGAIRLLYRPGHYDLLYQPEPTVNMQPIVNLQYAMSSDYTPWNTSDLSFDVNAGLMAIPNLMMDAPFGFAPSMSQPPSDPYRVSPPQEVYQPPVHTPAPPPPITSPSPQIRLTEPHPDMSSLPPRSNDGVQIRLNPLAMKSNLSHSLPVTPPFKNSPYNQAHFQNSDFEPIHWEPHESRR